MFLLLLCTWNALKCLKLHKSKPCFVNVITGSFHSVIGEVTKLTSVAWLLDSIHFIHSFHSFPIISTELVMFPATWRNCSSLVGFWNWDWFLFSFSCLNTRSWKVNIESSSVSHSAVVSVRRPVCSTCIARNQRWRTVSSCTSWSSASCSMTATPTSPTASAMRWSQRLWCRPPSSSCSWPRSVRAVCLSVWRAFFQRSLLTHRIYIYTYIQENTKQSEETSRKQEDNIIIIY